MASSTGQTGMNAHLGGGKGGGGVGREGVQKSLIERTESSRP